MMPAFTVQINDPYEPAGCVVFAKTDIEARRKGANELDCDEIGGLECRRAKWADEYEPMGYVPATVMLANNWSLSCSGCEQMIYDGGEVTRYDEDDQEYEVEVNPVDHGRHVYCTPECRDRDLTQSARRKRGERRFWEALKREALRKLPGIVIDPEKSGACYFGHHTKSKRDRAICFVVCFSFPGSKYGGKYRYDLGYDDTRGKRQILIANGDMEAWDAFRAGQTIHSPDDKEGEQ